MAPDSVQKWLYGSQANLERNSPNTPTENSWDRSKRLRSLWHSPEFGKATSFEENE